MDLRHKFNKANSYAKACEQVENMEKEFINLISKKRISSCCLSLDDWFTVIADNWIFEFSIGERQAKATSKDVAYPSRDVNLAPITEDEELPTGNPNDDEEVKHWIQSKFHWFHRFFLSPKDDEDRDENNEEEEEEGDDDEDGRPGTDRSRRSRPSGGSAGRTSGGSGADEEYIDTDDNDGTGFDEDPNTTNANSTERTKVVSAEDADFMKAFDALVAESVAVSYLF